MRPNVAVGICLGYFATSGFAIHDWPQDGVAEEVASPLTLGTSQTEPPLWSISQVSSLNSQSKSLLNLPNSDSSSLLSSSHKTNTSEALLSSSHELAATDAWNSSFLSLLSYAAARVQELNKSKSIHTTDTLCSVAAVLVGVMAMILGSTLVAIGLLVQKASHMVHHQQALQNATSAANFRMRRHMRVSPLTSPPTKPYWQQPRWLLGCLPMLVGFFFSWSGQIAAPQLATLCFNGWCIAFTLVAGPVIPGERVQSFTLAGSVLCVFGCVWTTLSGRDVHAYMYDLVDLFFQILAKPLSCNIFMCFVVVLLIYCIRRFRMTTPLTTFELSSMAAISGWFTITLSRHAGSILSSKYIAWSEDIASLLFLICSICSFGGILCSVHCVNLGLRRGDAVVTIPAYMGVAMLGSTIYSVGLTITCKWLGCGTATPHYQSLPGDFMICIGVIIIGMAVPEFSAEVEDELVVREDNRKDTILNIPADTDGTRLWKGKANMPDPKGRQVFPGVSTRTQSSSSSENVQVGDAAVETMSRKSRVGPQQLWLTPRTDMPPPREISRFSEGEILVQKPRLLPLPFDARSTSDGFSGSSVAEVEESQGQLSSRLSTLSGQKSRAPVSIPSQLVDAAGVSQFESF